MCLPGSAQAENSAWTSQLLHRQLVILWNRSGRLSKGSLTLFLPCTHGEPRHRQQALPMYLVGPGQARRGQVNYLSPFPFCPHGSPGTSSMHCLCASVGPGHAEAQADELPMHPAAGAQAKAILRLRSPGTGRPSCLCASLAVPRQVTCLDQPAAAPANCFLWKFSGRHSKGLPSLSCLLSWQPRHKQHALPMCLSGPWPYRGAGRRTTYAPNCWGPGQRDLCPD